LAELVLPQVGAGLAELHRLATSHGDLKPSNIFLADDGRVILLDAGLSRIIFADDVPIMIGTPEYMAPEQVATEAPGDRLDRPAPGGRARPETPPRARHGGLPVRRRIRRPARQKRPCGSD
jgi:serine/threonine-protein kinase